MYLRTKNPHINTNYEIAPLKRRGKSFLSSDFAILTELHNTMQETLRNTPTCQMQHFLTRYLFATFLSFEKELPLS